MIRHIFFDLDSTLYSINYGLDKDFSERLKRYVSAWLNLPWEECAAMRDEKYGTALEWLITDKSFADVDDYFANVHPENEADSLLPDPELRFLLETLPCPFSILTNSPLFHAKRIINKLKVADLFQNIFSIEYFNFHGKPNASSYQKALDTLGLKPEEVLFVDDIPYYVDGYITMGGKGLLLDENDIHKNYPYEKIKNLKEIIRFLD